MQDFDEVVKLSVSSLRAHPQNDELNSPLNVYEKNALKSSIRENGIAEPLLVLEDGTIVSGQLLQELQECLEERRHGE